MNANDPAFPVSQDQLDYRPRAGITIRAYFAGVALQGLLASERGFVRMDEAPENAVKIADALIEELNKP